MFSYLQSKKEELKDKYMSGNVLQKGFTLLEVLAVVVIILILLGIVVAAFTFFGRVDGTELNAESKQVESAVLQASLADDERAIPGIAVDGDKVYVDASTEVVPSRKDTSNVLVQGVDETSFYSPDQAAYVIHEVAKTVGLDGNDLAALMRPVKSDIQDTTAGKAEVSEYYVVLKKSQLYNGAALNHFDGYNDSLAGMVFSKDTIIDNDAVFYNGSHNVASATGKEDAATGAAAVVFLGNIGDASAGAPNGEKLDHE